MLYYEWVDVNKEISGRHKAYMVSMELTRNAFRGFQKTCGKENIPWKKYA